MYDNLLRQVTALYIIIYARLSKEEKDKQTKEEQSKNTSITNYDKFVKEFLELKKPNKIILGKLIKIIYLSEEGKIDLYYKVQKPYKKR